jgi:hypothetical protein
MKKYHQHIFTTLLLNGVVELNLYIIIVAMSIGSGTIRKVLIILVYATKGPIREKIKHDHNAPAKAME